MPSIAAPAISSTYFSKDKEAMSLSICSLLSAPKDWRIRLIKAVWRFSDESRAFDGAFRGELSYATCLIERNIPTFINKVFILAL